METDLGRGVSHWDQLWNSLPSKMWPVSQLTLRLGGLLSGEARVSAMSFDADRKRVNQTVSTVPDGMDVNVSQWDSRTQWPPSAGGGAVSVDGGTYVVGGPASAIDG